MQCILFVNHSMDLWSDTVFNEFSPPPFSFQNSLFLNDWLDCRKQYRILQNIFKNNKRKRAVHDPLGMKLLIKRIVCLTNSPRRRNVELVSEIHLDEMVSGCPLFPIHCRMGTIVLSPSQNFLFGALPPTGSKGLITTGTSWIAEEHLIHHLLLCAGTLQREIDDC